VTQNIWDFVQWLLGTNAQDLQSWHMIVRALVVYAAALAMVRLGEKRFLGRSTAFDIILGMILGTMISRAINGTAAFFPTLGVGFVLVGLHWLLSTIAFHWEGFSDLIKGHPTLILEEGKIRPEAMLQGHISSNDLLEAARTQAGLGSLEKIQEATLERSGKISIVPAVRQPKLLDVRVADGVQTVRIVME
jgi:uncharacterized membrane protein YcaP (DUF421 family)